MECWQHSAIISLCFFFIKIYSDESSRCIRMKVYYPGDVFLWGHKDIYGAICNPSNINGTFGTQYIWNIEAEFITNCHEFGKFWSSIKTR